MSVLWYEHPCLATILVASHALDCSCASFDPSGAMECAAANAVHGSERGNAGQKKIMKGKRKIRCTENADSRMM